MIQANANEDGGSRVLALAGQKETQNGFLFRLFGLQDTVQKTGRPKALLNLLSWQRVHAQDQVRLPADVGLHWEPSPWKPGRQWQV